MKLAKYYSRYMGFPRSIYILFFAITVNRFGNFVIPFLSMYLTKNLNFNTDKTGFLVMLASLAGIPGLFLGGLLVDRIGRKRILALFQFLSACCFIPCALNPVSSVVPWLMILSVLFAETAQVAHGAMVSDLTCNENRKEAYSLIYLGINLGFSIGPILAGFLFNSHIRLFFLIDSMTTLFSVLLIALFTHETLPDKKAMAQLENRHDCDERQERGSIFGVLLKRPLLPAFLVLNLFYFFVYSQHTFSMPLYLDHLFAEGGSQAYGIMMTVNAVFVVLATTLMTTLTRNNNAIANIAIAGLLYAAGFGMLFFVSSFGMFIVSTIIWTAGEILSMVNMNVYTAQHSPISHRGRFNSARLLFGRAGMAMGPFIMGFVIKSWGIRSVWLLVFLLAVCGSAGAFLMNLAERRSLNGGTAEPADIGG